jgi:hypothetical protein
MKIEVNMFGLYYSILGLLFGTACSYIARDKNRNQKNWFWLGFVFQIIPVIILWLIPIMSDERNDFTELYPER